MARENENAECCMEECVHEDLLKIVNETMPEETELYDLAELFKVFGDSTRIRILFVLFEAEVCVRSCTGAEYDTVCNLTPAAYLKTEQVGQKPQRRKVYLLFTGRRTCAYNYRTGTRAYRGRSLNFERKLKKLTHS